MIDEGHDIVVIVVCTQAELTEQRNAAEAELEARRQKISLQIQKLFIDIGAHREQTSLFRTAIIPQAEQSLAAALAGYQVDKVDFLTLLNNQVSLLNFEIGYLQHRMAYEKSLSQVEATIGVPLFVPHVQQHEGQ